ncbi:putative L-ascorbate peroxidase 4, peroxisomal [Silene latifolia]|uniref:putative L-ascorbate peroxidase 4, peroxisomal n=1 Tax=Silene latifolia TaxID=37657 RepID=UPI003D771857
MTTRKGQVNDAEYLKEIDKARRDLRALIFSKQCAPIMLRLAWHDAGTTYDVKTKTGGPNGSIRYELSHGANRGLKVAIDLCEEIKAKHPKITYADLYQRMYGCTSACWSRGCGSLRFSTISSDILINNQDCPSSTVEGRLPDANGGGEHLREIFYRMGFSDKDMVALSGAHTLVRAYADRSGFKGAWTPEPLKFDNSYFVEMLKGERAGMLKLPTDKVLVQGPVFLPYVELYNSHHCTLLLGLFTSQVRLLYLRRSCMHMATR